MVGAVRRWVSLVTLAVALGLGASLAAAAWHDVSQAYDSGYYHLPFAARLSGIVSAHEYQFGPPNAARFAGFPLLGELLQGVLWRVTGRPQGANFVALGSLIVASIAWRRYGLPPATTFVGLLAIPLVMTHATSTYVDLPASLALATAFLELTASPGMNVHPLRVQPRQHVVIVAALLAASANMRFQHVPAVTLLFVWLGLSVLRRSPRQLGWYLAMAPLVYLTPLKNVLMHGNPVFPVEFHVLGRTLPFAETTYASVPDYLEGTPRVAIFARSVLEVGLRELSDPVRYSVDQWTPSGHHGARMGGFFFPLVLVHITSIVWGLRSRTLRRRTALGFVVLVTLTAWLPQSHELRYYLYVGILLVALGLRALQRSPSLAAGLSLALLAAVVLQTEAAWIRAGGSTFEELRSRKVDGEKVRSTPDGATLCVWAPPWTLLYAARFHGRHYALVEGEAGCSRSGDRP